MPETYLFSTKIPIRITDLNYGNHLGNDALLSILHESRVRFLNSLGYSEGDIEGIGIMMADVVIIYKFQGFYGDILKIEIGIDDISKKSCDFYYRITNQQEKVVAICKTAIVFYDYQSQKPAAIPERFVRKIQIKLNEKPQTSDEII
jgi:YbgC/YbaW family acyl-CoA thioester hydrolase